MESHNLIADVSDGVFEGQIYVVSVRTATGRTGKDYLTGVCADRSGEVEYKVWDALGQIVPVLTRGSFVQVRARVGNFQGKKQFNILDASPILSENVQWDLFRSPAPPGLEKSWEELKAILGTLSSPGAKKFLAELWLEPELETRFKTYPAAKSVHHAYQGGLLVHCLSILKILDFLCAHYGKLVNRDLVLLGGLLHDVGKLWEMNFDFRCEYTLEGQLIGHLVQGVELIDRVNKRSQTGLSDFELLQLKHIILSHHGELEYGSPKLPSTLEAWIVHSVDLLDSKFETFRMAANDVDDRGWSPFNRFLDRSVFNPHRKEPNRTQQTGDRGDVIRSVLANLKLDEKK